MTGVVPGTVVDAKYFKVTELTASLFPFPVTKPLVVKLVVPRSKAVP